MMKTNLFIMMLLLTPFALGTQVDISFKDSGGREQISVRYASSQMITEKNTNRGHGSFLVGKFECNQCQTSEARILEIVSTNNPEMWSPLAAVLGSNLDDQQVFSINGRVIPYLSGVHIQLQAVMAQDLSHLKIKPVDADEVIELIHGKSRTLSVTKYKDGKESHRSYSAEKFCGRKNESRICEWKSNLIYQIQK